MRSATSHSSQHGAGNWFLSHARMHCGAARHAHAVYECPSPPRPSHEPCLPPPPPLHQWPPGDTVGGKLQVVEEELLKYVQVGGAAGVAGAQGCTTAYILLLQPGGGPRAWGGVRLSSVGWTMPACSGR